MKLICNIVILSAIALLIIYVSNVLTFKIRHKNNYAKLKHRNHNRLKSSSPNKNKVQSDIINESDELHMQKYHVNRKQNKIKSKLKLSGQLADAKKKCWEEHSKADSTIMMDTFKIVNGSNTDIKTLLWMVSISFKDKWRCATCRFICGAALISSQFVLTAAHCMMGFSGRSYEPEAIMARMGTHDLSSASCTRRDIAKIFIHPEFKKEDDPTNDIAIMKLKDKVTFSKLIHPVCIPRLTAPPKWDTRVRKEPTLVAGWGSTGSNELPAILKSGFAYIVNNSVCAKRFGKYSQSTTICIGDRRKEAKVCQGDSGSPVVPVGNKTAKGSVVYPVVIGLVSFGDFNCKGPDVLTKVESFIDWINDCTSK